MSTENSTAIARRPSKILGLDMQDLSSVSGLIFNSRVYGDIATKEAAAIKIVAGMEYGFNPFQSMSMIDFIQGRPTLNAHGKATLINSSGDFRLKIVTLTAENCEIDVCRKDDKGDWKVINRSTFTIDDAKKAELTTGKNAHSWKKYPRNMLFARCVSNIWRWDCAELNMRHFKPDQISEFEAEELDETDVQPEQQAEPVTEQVNGDTVDVETGEVIHEGEVVIEEEVDAEPIDEAESKLEDLRIAARDRYRELEGTQKAAANKFLGTKSISDLDADALKAFLTEFAEA